jgi:hypothetical protein
MTVNAHWQNHHIEGYAIAAIEVLTARLPADQPVIDREDGRMVGSPVFAVRVRRHRADERPARVRPA